MSNAKTKAVCQLDRMGCFSGMTVADESPMEPGKYLLPSGCIDLPEPAKVEGKVAKAEGGKWVYVDPHAVSDVLPSEPEDGRLTNAQAVEFLLNEKAAAYGFDSMISAVSYADEPAVPKFQADGKALRKWRSEVWAAYFELVASNDGKEPGMDVGELREVLPAMPEADPFDGDLIHDAR